MTKSKLNNVLSNQELREACKKSLLFTLVYFWDTIVRDEMRYNWHLSYLCSELQKVGENVIARNEKTYDLIINIPPGTTKSTITTIVFPVWLWINDPSIRIISNSYSLAISIEHSMRSRDIIDSEKFKALFPEIKIRGDKSGKQHYENIKGGSRYAVSTGGSVTGSHAHIIINDDPQNPTQAESELGRIQANEHTKTLATRKVDKSLTPTILIMQRLHEKDVTGYMLEKKEGAIKHIKLPSEVTSQTIPYPHDEVIDGKTILEHYEEAGGVLDKFRLTTKNIEEAKLDLGTRGYNGQFLQNPTVEEGDIVKKEWFKIISEGEFRKRIRSYTPIHFFLDTAYTDNSENDPTGILCACKIDNNMYITHRIKVRKEFPELIKFIPQYVKSNGYDEESTIRIEPKANGLSVIQTLKRETTLNITSTQSPKDSKKTRLYSVSPKIECGRVFLVEGFWNQEFVDEVSGFPNAAHDEDVDLLCYAIDYFLSESINSDEVVTNILW